MTRITPERAKLAKSETFVTPRLERLLAQQYPKEGTPKWGSGTMFAVTLDGDEAYSQDPTLPLVGISAVTDARNLNQ